MTIPTLSLGIAASGAQQVLELARSVNALRNNLVELAATAKASGVNLGQASNGMGDAVKELQAMRREMGEAVAGIRTDLAAGFKAAYDRAAAEVRQGGDKLEQEAKKAAAKIRVASAALDLGGGLKASASGAGLGAVDAVRAKFAEIEKAAAEQLRVAAQVEAIAKSVSVAMNSAAGAFQRYNPSTGLKGAVVGLQETKQVAQEQLTAAKQIEAIAKSVAVAMNNAAGAFQRYNPDSGMKGAIVPFKSLMPTGTVERIEADAARLQAAFRRIDEAPKISASFRSLQQDISASSEVMKTELRKMYVELERVSNLKAAIRGRLGTDNLAGGGSSVARQGLTLDQKDMQYAQGMAGLRAYYSEMEKAANAVETSVTKKTKAVNTAVKPMQHLTAQMQDAHSAARGLASGFNAIWLTWGNVAPLLAGAAVSHAVVKTFSIGSEVAYNIKFLELMSDSTREHSAIITAELQRMSASSKFSLQDMSKTLVNLGQAGKTQAEAMQMLKPVADLATVGMVDLDTATKLVVQAQALYGLRTSETNKLVSQLYHTTKSGTINVEDLGASFKYASEANTRFGVSVEETLTLLKALGQAGIRGSSGGTAFINFMRDLHGRSGPAIKAMKDLEKASGSTIKLFTMEGGVERMRSATEIFKDIAQAAGKLRLEDQDRILGKLFSDRGGRQFFAMIREGTVSLDDFRKELEKINPDLAGRSAEELLKSTAKGQLELTKRALENSLAAVFNQYEQGFVRLLEQLRALVSSSGFQQFLSSIVVGAQAVGNALLALQGPLTWMAGIWLAYKSFGVVAVVLTSISAAMMTLAGRAYATTAAIGGLTASLHAKTIATVEAAAAQRALALGMGATAAATVGQSAAAAAATGMLGRLAGVAAFLVNPLTGIIATLGILAYSWYSMSKAGIDGSTSLSETVARTGRLNINQLEKEIDTIRRRNELLGQKKDVYAGVEEGIAAAREKSRETLKQIYETELELGSNDPTQEKITNKKLASLRELYTKQAASVREGEKRLSAERSYAALEEAEKAKEERRKLNAQMAGMPSTPDAASLADAGKAGRGFAKLPRDNAMQQLEQRLNAEEGVLRQSYDRQIKLLNSKHQAELLNDGAYQAEVLNRTAEHEADYRKLLQGATEQMAELYAKRRETIEKSGLDPESKKTELENLKNSYETFTERVNTALSKLNTEALYRQEDAVIRIDSARNKLLKTEAAYWQQAEANMSKEVEQIALQEQTAFMTEEQRVRMEAMGRVTQQHAAHIDQLRLTYLGAIASLSAFNAAFKFQGPMTEEQTKQYNDLLTNVLDLGKGIQEATAKTAQLGETAAEAATRALRSKNFKSIADSATDVLTNSVLDGFKDGGKAAKDWLKQYFLRDPIRIVVQALMQPIGQGLASVATGLMNGAGNTVASGGANLIGSVASLFGAGGLGGSLAAGAGWMTGATTFSGALGAATSLIGTGTAGGAMSGLGMLAGALGPIAIGVGLISSLVGGKGETRSGGQYNMGELLAAPSGGEIGTAQAMSKAAMATINTTLAALGSSDVLTNFMTGLESSGKGKAFAYAGGTLRSGGIFGEGWGAAFSGSTLGLSTNAGNMTPEEAMTAFTKELKQVTLQALNAAADVPKAVRDLLKDKDINALAETELDSLLTQINDMIVAVSKFRLAIATLPFEPLKNLSFEAAQGLAALSGGIDNLITNLQTYYTKFYSKDEQRMQSARNILSTLQGAGGTYTLDDILNSDRQRFRQTVDYYMTRTDDAGRSLFAALLSVAGAFDELHPVAETVVEDLKETADALADLDSKLDDAFSAFERVVQREIDRLTAQRDAAKALADQLRSLFELLRDNVKELYSEVTSTSAMNALAGRAFVTQALASARAGNLPAAGPLGDAIAAARGGIVEERYATKIDFDRDRLRLAGELSQLKDLVEPQLSSAEQTVELLDKQIVALEQSLDYWREQVEISKGLLDSNLTIAEATVALATAVTTRVLVGAATSSSGASAGSAGSAGGAVFGGGGAVGSGAGFRLSSGAYGNSAGQITFSNGLGFDYSGFALANLNDPAGIAARSVAMGLSMADVAALMGKNPADVETWFNLQGVPSFRVGTPFVAQDTLAVLHAGEAVMPAFEAARWKDSTSADTAREIRILQAKLQQLTEISLQNMINTRRSADLADRWDTDGLPQERTV